MLSCFEKVPRKKSGFDVHKAVKKLKRKFSLNFNSDYVLSSKCAKFDLVTDILRHRYFLSLLGKTINYSFFYLGALSFRSTSRSFHPATPHIYTFGEDQPP
jgi:hypothetical protein